MIAFSLSASLIERFGMGWPANEITVPVPRGVLMQAMVEAMFVSLSCRLCCAMRIDATRQWWLQNVVAAMIAM
ncbi:hypothetical protein U1872_18140 [Sphingomonas sp. RB3P16]|uniref:hypothetical protein n=1 Tax=Parasphingomonas frigoris TaxID=3096163 RepID=UPI002FC81A9A